MNLVFSILVLFSFMSPKNDKWIAKDKGLHIIHSACAVGLTYHIYHCELNNNHSGAVKFSVSLTSLAGITKEIFDSKKKPSSSSWRDLVADAIGIGLGVLIFCRGG